MNAHESEKTFLEEFRTERQAMVTCFTDFTPLIDAWKSLDTTEHPQYAALKDQVLEMWETRPELHGKHTDCSVFDKNEDFVKSAICIKFSLDQISKPDGMLMVLKFLLFRSTAAFTLWTQIVSLAAAYSRRLVNPFRWMSTLTSEAASSAV